MGNKKVIVIIGAGFSGTALTIQLIKNAKNLIKVVLVDRKYLARGVAYLQDKSNFKLNVRANQMGLFPDKVQDFYEWVKLKNNMVLPTDFIQREIYGDYLQDRLNESIESSKNVEVEIIKDEVVQVIKQSNQVVLSQGRTIVFDNLVIATGFNVNSYQEFVKIKPSTEPITIIGTGLTAIDALIYLQKIKYSGKIYLASRHGLLPRVHKSLSAQANTKIDINEKFDIPLLLLLKKIKMLLKQHDWYTVVDTLRPLVKKIWNNFNDHEKSQFIRYLKPYWEVHRHRISEEHFQLLNDLLQQKKIEIIKVGYKEFVPPTQNIISCKGLSVQELSQNSLIKSLLTQHILTIDKHKLGFNCDDSGKVNSDFVYILGPIRRAHFFECTAVPEIRQHAYDLALKLLESC